MQSDQHGNARGPPLEGTVVFAGFLSRVLRSLGNVKSLAQLVHVAIQYIHEP